nr:flavin reductase [Algibacillus agarilyticus]
MPTRYRAQLINSLSGFKSASLIGTVSHEGNTNLAIFSSVVHLGANPALVGFITRPDSVERHTLTNILQTHHYTINHISQHIWQAAHQTSARYPSNVSEFDETGLTPEFKHANLAPFVKESELKYSLKLVEVLPINANNTQMVIGEITRIITEEHAIQADGYIDIEKLNTVTVSGLDSYHSTSRLSRLAYAKPNIDPLKIELCGTTD